MSEQNWQTLYMAVNEMMAALGRDGSISARDDRVQAVMDALHDIDGGTVTGSNNDGEESEMDFDEWHQQQLNGDPDNCPHEAWERKAWDAACNAAAALAEETAAGRDAEAIAEAILRMRSNVIVTGSGATTVEE